MLFNHESPLRAERFVTQKIARAAARIAAGHSQSLRLGNIAVERDWGWAPDYVDAMWRMLNSRQADDFVIATGRSVTLEYFARRVFAWFDLSWEGHVVIDDTLLRPTDILTSRADPQKAHRVLGWRHSMDVDGVIDALCRAAAQSVAGTPAN